MFVPTVTAQNPKLIVRKQISREAQQHGQDHQQHADAPIEFARTLVGAGHEDAEHVQPDGDDHQVRGPAMHVAQKLAERDVVFEIEDVAEGLHFRGVVIKHQQDAGESEDDEKVEGDATHAPGEIVFGGVAINFCGMQVEENVGEDAEGAVARLVIVLDAKHRAIELSLLRLFQPVNLLLGLFFERFAQRGSVGLHLFQDAGFVFAAAVFFRHSVLPLTKPNLSALLCLVLLLNFRRLCRACCVIRSEKLPDR